MHLRKLYDKMRVKGRSFSKYLSREKYTYWGYGIFEVKWVPSEGVYKPHYHLILFGHVPSQPTMQKRWTNINGKFQKLKCKYPPSRKDCKDLDAYKKRLKARRYAMLDYLCRRAAGVGLVMENDPLSRIEGKNRLFRDKELLTRITNQ